MKMLCVNSEGQYTNEYARNSKIVRGISGRIIDGDNTYLFDLSPYCCGIGTLVDAGAEYINPDHPKPSRSPYSFSAHYQWVRDEREFLSGWKLPADIDCFRDDE